jgi:hypothetical protein
MARSVSLVAPDSKTGSIVVISPPTIAKIDMTKILFVNCDAPLSEVNSGRLTCDLGV